MAQKSLIQKLVEIRSNVDYLKKDQQMKSGQKYDFVGAEQVYKSVRANMDEVGVYLKTEIVDTNVTHTTSNKGTATYFTELKMKMTWINADDPADIIECDWYAQGIDLAGEKGVGKALTYGGKYFIMSQFQIATGKDDPDDALNQEHIPDEGQHNSSQQQKSQPKPQPKEDRSVLDAGMCKGMIESLKSDDEKELNDIEAFVKTTKLSDESTKELGEIIDASTCKEELGVIYKLMSIVGMTSKQRQLLTSKFVSKRSGM